MRSTKEMYLRSGIGFVLAAIATFALVLPAGAQSQGQGQSKGQGTSGAEKSKDKTKDSSGVKGGVSGGVGYGKSYGGGLGLDGLSGDLDNVSALLEQVKSMDFSNMATNYADMATDLQYSLKYNFQNDFQLNLQNEIGLDSLQGSLFELQNDGRDREKDMARAHADRESSLYSQGTSAIDQGKWQIAEDKFDEVIEMKLKKADAAMFWKAWAQNKLGQRNEALATLSAMEKEYPQSRWLDEAKKLAVEVKQLSGQPVSPESESDCELKLLALNGLQQADPAKAVPLLEKMIHSTECVNPLVQEKAIQALGMYRAESGRETLGQIYASSTDADVKKAILRALAMSGDKARIFAAAKSEKDPDLRVEAIRQLGMMNDRDDIWQLYQGETSVDVKKQILNAMWQSGDVDRVSQLALNEKDPSLKMSAINALGMMDRRNGTKGEDTLLSIYAADTNPDVRKKVISALFMSNDAKALVALARKETDPEMKKRIVSQLSMMKSPDATAYLLELLNK